MSVAVSQVLNGYLYKAITSLAEIDYFNRVVGPDQDPNNVATAESSFVFCGPPVLDPETPYPGAREVGPVVDVVNGAVTNLSGIAQFLRPIGGIQQLALNDGRQVIPWQELGSRLKRHAVGSGLYNASMARVLTRAINLKASLYTWLPPFMQAVHKTTELEMALFPASNDESSSLASRMNLHFIGMESEIYGIPFGLLVITGAADGKHVHIEYLERCFMPTHGVGYAAGSNIITPNVSIMVTRPVPFVDSNGDYLIPKELLLKKNKTVAFKLLQGYQAVQPAAA